MAPVSIVVIDDHPILRTGLVSVLSAQSGFDVVASGSSAADVGSLVAQHRPDLLLIDICMPGNVFEAVAMLRTQNEKVRIVAFTASDRIDHAISAIEAGVNGYVLKGSTLQELNNAITAVLAGESFITPSFANKVIASIHAPATRGTPHQTHLSIREEQIVKLLLTGCTNKEIARNLSISDKTVKHYMTILMQKLSVRNRVEVVIAAQKLSGGHIMSVGRVN